MTDMEVEMERCRVGLAVAVPIASSMETEDRLAPIAPAIEAGRAQRRQETSESETKPFHFMNPGRFYRSPVPR